MIEAFSQQLFLLFHTASLLLFGLVDGGQFSNGVVAESLPTAAALVGVFDEPTNESAEEDDSSSSSSLPRTESMDTDSGAQRRDSKQ